MNCSSIREDYETEIQIIKDEHKTNVEEINETAEIDLSLLQILISTIQLFPTILYIHNVSNVMTTINNGLMLKIEH